MRSSIIVIGVSGLASQYNNLRADAAAAGMFLAHQQSTPNMTLAVEPGIGYIGNTQLIFTGGNSPTITAPITNPRIDLLTIDSVGTLALVTGAEGASPAVPAYPANKLVLCEIYNRVGETSIRDVDTAGKGYIQRDTRQFASVIYINNAAQITDGIITDAKLANTYVKPTGDQTIGGIKTFSSIPVLPASDPTTANQAVRKAYVDALTATSGELTVADGTLTIYYRKRGKFYFAFGVGTSGQSVSVYGDVASADRIASVLGKTISDYIYSITNVYNWTYEKYSGGAWGSGGGTGTNNPMLYGFVTTT